MAETYIDPKQKVIALVDAYDEEAGADLSAYGKDVVRSRLQAIGYNDVIFMPAAEMNQHVNACPGGGWYREGMQLREGWTFFHTPDAEVLVDVAGIDFTDERMWDEPALDLE